MFRKLRDMLGGAKDGGGEFGLPDRIEPIHLDESDLDDGDLPPDEPDRSLDAAVHYLSALTNAHDAT